MKTIFLLLVLSISINVYSQDFSKLILGDWKLLNTTTLSDSLFDAHIDRYDLSVDSIGNFTVFIDSTNIVHGQWSIADSIFSIKGTREGREKLQEYDLSIYTITDEKLSFKLPGYTFPILLNLTKAKTEE